jgi:hypothetical protein
MTQRQQLLAVAAQLAGEPGGGDPLGEASEDQHQFDDRPLGALQSRTGEGVEDPTAGRAAIVEDRGAMAAMDAQAVAGPAAGASQTGGVKPGEQLGVAGVRVHQLGEGV